jgi:hypothetical protein
MSYVETVDFERLPSALDNGPETEEAQLNLDYADRDTTRAAHKSARAREIQFDETLAGIMSTPQGRAFVRVLLFEWCHVEDTTFAAEHAQMAFAAGERNVGQRLKAAVVRLAPNDFLKMLMENANAAS